MLKTWSSDECDIYFIDLLGGKKWGICVQTCMFNFQSQVLMDQINFFKLKDGICHKSVEAFFKFFVLLFQVYLV